MPLWIWYWFLEGKCGVFLEVLLVIGNLYWCEFKHLHLPTGRPQFLVLAISQKILGVVCTKMEVDGTEQPSTSVQYSGPSKVSSRPIVVIVIGRIYLQDLFSVYSLPQEWRAVAKVP